VRPFILTIKNIFIVCAVGRRSSFQAALFFYMLYIYKKTELKYEFRT
jgi:rhodanese-related sulfurtransferase